MQFDRLSNTLTFQQQGKDGDQALERLVAMLKAAPEVEHFRVVGPLTTRVTRRRYVMLTFNSQQAAISALDFAQRNFKAQ